MNRDKIITAIKTKTDKLNQLKQQRADLSKKLDTIEKQYAGSEFTNENTEVKLPVSQTPRISAQSLRISAKFQQEQELAQSLRISAKFLQEQELAQSIITPEISPNISSPACKFNNWIGEYNSSIMLGFTTDAFEDIVMEKSYVFLSECISEYYTTKPIYGIKLDSKWNDGTNGTIVLIAKENIKIIKCISQPFRGHNWHLRIYFA